MSGEKEYITCLNCGNPKAVIIYNPKTGKRAGYHCPCLEPHRDETKDVKPNSACFPLQDADTILNKIKLKITKKK